MYVHPRHRLEDRSALHALIEAHPLGAWVLAGPQGLVANHLPWLLDRSRGPQGSLLGHVARANPVWRDLQPGLPSVVMFRGPQAYVTPGWYPGKAAHGCVVPTWNYAAATVHGCARAIEDPAWLRDLLDRLSAVHESGYAQPWRPADAPPGCIDALLRAVVGIELPIERIEGKCKASQDEDLADRWGTVAGLQAQGGDEARTVAGLVRAALVAEGHEAPTGDGPRDVQGDRWVDARVDAPGAGTTGGPAPEGD